MSCFIRFTALIIFGDRPQKYIPVIFGTTYRTGWFDERVDDPMMGECRGDRTVIFPLETVIDMREAVDRGDLV
jgi:hypothetical protein